MSYLKTGPEAGTCDFCERPTKVFWRIGHPVRLVHYCEGCKDGEAVPCATCGEPADVDDLTPAEAEEALCEACAEGPELEPARPDSPCAWLTHLGALAALDD